MPNYQEGKIYKIYNTINDDIYIGSTTQKLCERMRHHRCSISQSTKGNRLIHKAFIGLGVKNFFIELIEKCPCNDKDELRKKEGEYIRSLKPSLNMRIEGRNKKEYYIDNKEHIREIHKEWREKNKEYKEQKDKEWRENNKETRARKAKTYYENNKEYILEKTNQYNENNKEHLKSYAKEKITCECGCDITRNCLAQHKRSAKHQQLMNE